MKLHLEKNNDTEALVEVTATESELTSIKNKVVARLSRQVKVAGFRTGKVPAEIAQKHIDQQLLQTEFLNDAINAMYVAILKEESIRPVAQPKADVKKFVPFTVLEVSFTIAVVGEVTLPNYMKTTAKRDKPVVKKADIDKVLENLQQRLAERSEVARSAKLKDEAVMDFSGTDKDEKPIAGADGTDYPLQLGSGSFIPGFEENIVGLKSGEKKQFTVTFPKDYGAKHLQNAPVTFNVELKKLYEIKLPKLDDAFAAQVGPFKTLEELKDDIKKQLEAENIQKAERDYEAALLDELVAKTKVAIPDSLMDEQKNAILKELRQNVVQRGMTLQEYLDSQNTDEETYTKEQIEPEAERRIKAGILLSEIADKEGIAVPDKELADRIEQLKTQYSDEKMQSELDNPDNQREIRARMRSEKVIAFLKK